jgi:pimeloyl-ACP methyl ester carboxylesterase
MQAPRREITRTPYTFGFREVSGFKDTYGGEQGWVFLEAMLTRPVGRESTTAIVFSHPIGGGAFLPIMGALARAGHHVVYVNTRYRGNDSALIMEKCAVDLAAGIRDLKKRFGYERVVLGGWSGGGSLALFYQEQAEQPTVTSTPAGDAVDLTREELPRGDALFLVAAHVSRAATLTEWLDASILDENQPFVRNPELNLYDPRNANQPPYAEAFVARYREAQLARNARITRWVEQELIDVRRREGEGAERAFVVHGTMADPRFLDANLDPNERTPGRCYLGEPRLVNDGPVGLARFCTLRSWLSQWSLERTNAHGERNGARTHVPTLVVGNGADDACTPSHTQRLFDAIPHSDKELHTIAGATHYYANQPEQLGQCVALYGDWLRKHELDRV